MARSGIDRCSERGNQNDTALSVGAWAFPKAARDERGKNPDWKRRQSAACIAFGYSGISYDSGKRRLPDSGPAGRDRNRAGSRYASETISGTVSTVSDSAGILCGKSGCVGRSKRIDCAADSERQGGRRRVQTLKIASKWDRKTQSEDAGKGGCSHACK